MGQDSEQKGVDAVDRALAILECFATADQPLSLAQIAGETGLYKSTILRLLNSLIRFGYLERDEHGQYRLASTVWRLGAQYRASFSLGDGIRAELARLAEATGETASFYVRRGDTRLCLYRSEPERAIRHSVAEGVELPIGMGASGKVLQAFDRDAGSQWDHIRKAGFATSRGERNPDVAAIAAPVFDQSGRLRGAIAVSGPVTRLDEAATARIAKLLTERAAALIIPA
ncbi:IclR family transcriptional regulator [Martelella mediterranea]|uniref:IclR family transcriptional regulator n=1 Tax=Martelella mediterranea TaxID=293089 RepID=UPI001E34AA87|nr:IclR family transcriptional regulator [Martelella mediterranea]MCD1633486.1 IclR family transcriptional regulator [Martelella mediterranea]